MADQMDLDDEANQSSSILATSGPSGDKKRFEVKKVCWLIWPERCCIEWSH